MKKIALFLTIILVLLSFSKSTYAQDDNEPIRYFQMEPLNDSLFIKIQNEVFIDPPDPKAEIIVDLRDANNQTISIKGVLYPFLAFIPETRAQIITYPFKLNLEEETGFLSVFTSVIKKIKFKNIVRPPTKNQIVSTLHYVNPFFQLFGGERFGIPFKKDIGISFGIGTPYSGPLETNFVEANIHILGFYGGAFGAIEEFTLIKNKNNHNNIFATQGYQVGYVIPFGNFFKVSYMKVTKEATPFQLSRFNKFNISKFNYKPKILTDSYTNWEFRYPLSVLGSTRGRVYIGKYLNEWHAGFEGRELSVAGSTFDLIFDAMPKSDVRQPQYLLEIFVQKIAESWAFSSFAIGPSIVVSKLEDGKWGVLTLFVNFRLKMGTSF